MISAMLIPGDPLPIQWRVTMNDGAVVGVWANSYGEENGYYLFDVFAEVSEAEEQNLDLVITSTNPTQPRKVLFAVARFPVEAVARIESENWDDVSAT
ncbi:hypothetical protein [Allokutzneria oryzae]|uniref:Uncharacterized protein n=1 Tax=Allokutzneria oryzae TaxID=1378989 RepID=A0ABV5ZPS5_9PSEU